MKKENVADKQEFFFKSIGANPGMILILELAEDDFKNKLTFQIFLLLQKILFWT